MSQTSEKQLPHVTVIHAIQAETSYQVGHQNTVGAREEKQPCSTYESGKVHLRRGWWSKSRDSLSNSHHLVPDYIDYLYNSKRQDF